ncbi:cysteine synthase A [Jeotgalibaca porci]|uniref:Cysteine synthase n=2 Tax=Jeotgalibaca porci TaxID=1868793 RepID=A0A6G7WEU2_9LACT|nr:cysteine synthase A [Jeotgalibaca porci]QIK50814.1 cysteine synthase A [Jeotgalibaca porci]
MSKVYTSLDQIVGKTPLLELQKVKEILSLKGNVVAKLEYFNPAGSVKDRIAKAMINDAEERGVLKPGGIIIEPTSGNTGIGLASVAAARGYKTILVMPETMSIERRKLMKGYGAEIVLTPGDQGISGSIEKAKEMVKEHENAFMPDQFSNPANPKVHYETTGPEIWEDTDGEIDIFVSGVGTGGTISGAGKYLKEKNPDIKVVAVEPAGSPVLSKGEKGPHKIQGIGTGFIPKTLNTDIYDEVLTVTNEEAYETARNLGGQEGVFVGISSGAALHAAYELAKRSENEGKRIVVLLPDSGDRYLSIEKFAE